MKSKIKLKMESKVKPIMKVNVPMKSWLGPRVISRGTRGGSLLVKITVHFWELYSPEILVLVLHFKVYRPCFQSVLYCYDQSCTAI